MSIPGDVELEKRVRELEIEMKIITRLHDRLLSLIIDANAKATVAEMLAKEKPQAPYQVDANQGSTEGSSEIPELMETIPGYTNDPEDGETPEGKEPAKSTPGKRLTYYTKIIDSMVGEQKEEIKTEGPTT